MLGRHIWLLLALVCAAHFFVLQVFFKAEGNERFIVGKRIHLSLEVIDTRQPTAVLSEKVELPKSQPTTPSTWLKNAPPQPTRQTPKPTLPPQQPAQSSGVDPVFDRSRFLDFDAVDQSAISTDEFDPTLTKVLPTRFESIVLELLIDETGRTVQVACIEGECPAAMDGDLQQLLVVPFLPAIKDGQAVASRKVIQISPTPTFGL